jgi:hypothetical protein
MGRSAVVIGAANAYDVARSVLRQTCRRQRTAAQCRTWERDARLAETLEEMPADTVEIVEGDEGASVA